MSLRLRLTLWYTGLLAALLLLVGAMVYSRVQTSVVGSIDQELQQRGDQIARLAGLTSGTTLLADPLLTLISASFESEMFVQIRENSGRTIIRSTNLGRSVIELPAAYYQQALNGYAGFYNLSISHPGDLRVYFTPIIVGHRTVGIVQMARSLAPQQAILKELSNNLLILFAIALALAAGGGYWLIGVALQPINESTATALAITRTGNLKRRVPVHRQRIDEIGALVSTFNEMLDRLEELFEKQRRFTGDISHELRSPLTTILGNLSLLRRAHSLPPEEQADMLAEMHSEAERMHRLISDLLLLSQAEAGLSLNRAPVELDTLLLQSYRLAQRRANGSHTIQLLHEDQIIVQGDADRLRQILDNIINNALRYTPAGGLIQLSLHCQQDQAIISISDNGPGIAPQDLPHIFERFYRADKARTRAAGGTGLGLSIVKWLVDAHHGHIEVETAPEEGTTFRIYLPVAVPCSPTASS
jgi:heavy metal sensor kinase